MKSEINIKVIDSRIFDRCLNEDEDHAVSNFLNKKHRLKLPTRKSSLEYNGEIFNSKN